MRLHKTKRLHWLTFGLRLKAFRLHQGYGKFTNIGLHVCACGLFCLWTWNRVSVGVSRVCGAFIAPTFERRSYGIKTVVGWWSTRHNEKAKMRGWGYILGVTGVTKLLPEHTVRGGGKSPKNGVKYKKLTLSVQLFRGCIMPQSPINSGFFCVCGVVSVGGTPLTGYLVTI